MDQNDCGCSSQGQGVPLWKRASRLTFDSFLERVVRREQLGTRCLVIFLDETMKIISASLYSLMAFAVVSGNALAQQSGSNLPDAFKGIVVAKTSVAPPDAFMYAARPEFSQPSLSPLGTRVALISRQDDSVSTLAVLDISGKTVTPIFKLEIPYMKSVRTYGWASEDKLVVWAEINNTANSSDENPRPSLYIARLDLKTKTVSERVQSNQISSELVRAPWRDPNHVLISECYQKQPVKSKTRLDEGDFNMTNSDTLPINTNYCKLLDWDLETNKASSYGKAVYGYPIRFLADRAGSKMFYEVRKLGGVMMHASWDAKGNKWLPAENKNTVELQEIWDSSELDYPDIWAKIHKLLPDRINPAGNVIKTSGMGQPLGVQFSSPDLRFGPFDGDSRIAQDMLTATFARYKIFAGSTIKWLGVTDDRGVILFSVESAINPGTYYVWHRTDNTIARVTNMRTLNEQTLGETYMEPGWLPKYLPVAVTPARNTAQSKGMVLMPMVVDDEAAAAELHTVNLTAEWFAVNGLTVVRVPVGLPAAPGKAESGDVWRKQIAQRIAVVARNVRKEFNLEEYGPACVYGKDSAAYAALAAVAYGSSLSCAIAFNAKLDPKLFAEPYPRINSSGKAAYLVNENIDLRVWARMYGANQLTGTPGTWSYPSNTDVMVGYEMFDDHRELSPFDGGLAEAVSNTGGKVTRYTANVNSSLADKWLSAQYEAMVSFILPPDIGLIGRAYVGDLEYKNDIKP